jgi:hypothetical protein
VLILLPFACIGCALVQNLGRLAIAMAGALASLVADAGAVQLSLDPPVQAGVGWTRVTGRYAAAARAPQFRATARCPGQAGEQTLDWAVRSRTADGTLWLDLPGAPTRLERLGMSCEAPELAIEMLVGREVVARAPVATREASALDAAVLAPPDEEVRRAPRRFGVGGQKYGSPSGKRTEAGVSWFLDSRVSIQLNYLRTAQPPTMSFDHDDGFLTRLLIGF